MNLLLEWLTHALLGAIVAEWFLGKKVGNVAMQWGALLGVAPDLLEIPPAVFLGTARTLQWHDGPLHSLLLGALTAWALCSLFGKLWKKQKVTRSAAFWWIYATWASHSLLDTLTIDGAAILWPIPSQYLTSKISFNLIQTPGPVPALFMAVTLVLLARLTTKKQLTTRRRLLLRGCVLTAAWFLVCLIIKLISTAAFDADLNRRNAKVHRLMETPVAYNLLLRRAVVEGPADFRVGYRSLFESFSTPVRWTIYPKDEQALDEKDKLTCGILARHTGGWLIARKHSRGSWVADLRHPEHRIWGEKKSMVDSRFPHAWNMLIEARGDKLQALHDTRHNPAESTRRMMSRTFGNKTTWEGNPRLAGVTGSLPECLIVDD